MYNLTYYLNTILPDTFKCLGYFLIYIIPCVLTLLLIYFFLKIPKYIFRKLLHIVAFSCFIVMINYTDNYLAVMLSCLIIIIVIYPLLSLLENKKWFSNLFVEKKKGEIKLSLVMLFSMYILLTFISWGLFNNKVALALSVLMWGVGDGCAAIIGIPYGKHKIKKISDGNKSIEGSISMLIACFIIGIVYLCIINYSLNALIVLKLLIASIVASLVEMITPSIYDTVSVPISILLILLI